MEDYNARREQQRVESITQAYMTASWQRAKKMPKLDRVLADLKPKEAAPLKPQTDEQMLAAAKRWQKRLVEGEN